MMTTEAAQSSAAQEPRGLLTQFRAPVSAVVTPAAVSAVTPPALATAAPLKSSANQEAVGDDRVALDALLAAIQADPRRKIDELAANSLFVSACRVEWARLGKVAPIVRALWGEDGYSGPKHSLVKGVVETFKDDQTMLAQMLAA